MRKDKVVSEVLGEELAIAPSDLYNAEFHSSLVGGYDKNEVDAFLERVADVFESLVRRVRDMKEQNEEQRAQIETYRQMETSLRDALSTAQKFNEDVLDAARRRADVLIEEARLVKERARMEATEIVGSLRDEIGALKTERNRLRTDLKAVLDTHQALLANLPTAENLTEPADENEAEEDQNMPPATSSPVLTKGFFEWEQESNASALGGDREPWPETGDQP